MNRISDRESVANDADGPRFNTTQDVSNEEGQRCAALNCAEDAHVVEVETEDSLLKKVGIAGDLVPELQHGEDTRAGRDELNYESSD